MCSYGIDWDRQGCHYSRCIPRFQMISSPSQPLLPGTGRLEEAVQLDRRCVQCFRDAKGDPYNVRR